MIYYFGNSIIPRFARAIDCQRDQCHVSRLPRKGRAKRHQIQFYDFGDDRIAEVVTTMQNQSQIYYTPIQPKMPAEMERMIEVDDPVYSFSEVLSHIYNENIIKAMDPLRHSGSMA